MLSFFNLLMNVAIIWSNESIMIPVGESLENYKYLPEAKLVMDGKEVYDKQMYYEYEINYTSFNVIRTHIVGSYTVWYRAHFPSVGFESDVGVTFNVYDHIKPTITGKKDIYIDVGTKTMDYKSLITYADNYDKLSDVTLSIYSAQVNLNQIGTYHVTYTAVDKAHNETTWIQNIHVVDQVKPTIKQKSQVTLAVGQTIDIDKYFTFTDNYDSSLKVTLDDQYIHYKKPGIYPATLYVEDGSKNQSALTFNVTLRDINGPNIILKNNHVYVNYQTLITESDLRSYIVAVEDNLDTLNISDVEIISYVDTSFLGKNEVIYRITDSSQLTGEAKLIIEVEDQTAPKIELIKDIVVDVNTLEPYIFDYLKIEDNYNVKESLTITKTGTISMSKIGENRIIVKVVDQAKNTTEFPVIVKVVDSIAPTLKVESKFVVTNFLKPNYDSFITVHDNYDKDILITIEDENVDYSIIGTHKIAITATDSSGNAAVAHIEVEIKDLSYPEIILKTSQAYIPYGEAVVDLLSYVEAVFDAYDKNLKITDIEVSTTLDTSKVGLYQVIYTIKDLSGNEGYAMLYVYLNDYEKPDITAQHITLKQNDTFNYFSYVHATDNYDGDITHIVKMNPSFIPLHQPGHYEVIFYVHDSSGNYAETKVLLTVESKKDITDYIYYIGGGLVLIVGIVLYNIYMKKREKM